MADKPPENLPLKTNKTEPPNKPQKPSQGSLGEGGQVNVGAIVQKKINEKNPAAASAEAQKLDTRFQMLLTLLTLLKDTRHKSKKTEFEFMMVNQTFNLVSYKQCIYWEWDGDHVTVKAVSGLVHMDKDGPYLQWIRALLQDVIKQKKLTDHKYDEEGHVISEHVKILSLTADDLQEGTSKDWAGWLPPYVNLLIFKDAQNTMLGGLLMTRDVVFSKLESAILEDLGDGYASRLSIFEAEARKSRGRLGSIFKSTGRVFRIVLVLLLLVMLIPVHTSVTGSAEIVPRSPIVVSVPFEGIIESVTVSPGQAVAENDILALMDSAMLENRAQMAVGDLLTAEVALRKTEREAFTDRAKLAEIAILNAQLAKKEAEKEFAQDMLARAELRAPRGGIAIFSDSNALRGKPVQAGEQIMSLADPEDVELMIRIPVDAMIEIDQSIPAKFFLNVLPLGFQQAHYQSIGYQATSDADGLMTYKIRARFDKETSEGVTIPRIGWTGTAKIYGERTILAFNILRRPFITLRRKLGI